MSSNLKRLLNDVDDVDYTAAEQYARRPPVPSPSPVRESDDRRSVSSASTATSPARTSSHYGAFGSSPTRTREDAPAPSSFRSGLGNFLGLSSSSFAGRTRDDLPGPVTSGLSILEREMDAFGQDLVAYGTSSSSGMSMRSSLSPYSSSVYAMPSPIGAPAPSVTSSEGHHEPEERGLVCYGMIHKIDVKIVGEMALLDARLAATAPHVPYQRFSLTELPDHIMLYFKDAAAASGPSSSSGHNTAFPAEFGYLRSHMKASLDQLLSHPDVEFEAVAPTGTLRDVIAGFKKSSDALIRVDVNVYGPRGKVAKTVGRMLSRKRLYLQTPSCPRPGLPYENPQRVSFSGMDRPAEGAQLRADLSTPRSYNNERVRRLVEDANQAVPRDYFSRARLSQPPRAELFAHQEEAVSFMLGRENGIRSAQPSLWEEKTEQGEKWYVHVITGHKFRNKPNESRGGILADEMGMGKTLATLALVAETLGDGRAWADGPKPTDAQFKGAACSRSTLVVVPSSGLMNHWVSEIESNLAIGLRCISYDVPSSYDVAQLQSSDVVITTYSVMAAEFAQKRSNFHKIGWFRVVLDEAHFVRSPSTPFHRLCGDLAARSRWCLTSTPVLSRLEDLGALLAFVRLIPFDSIAVFRRFVEIPFQQEEDEQYEAGPSAETGVTSEERVAKILAQAFMRRARQQVPALCPAESTRLVDLSLVERDHYDRVRQALARDISANKDGSVVSLDGITLLRYNMQLRMAASHGTFHRFRANQAVAVREEREAASNALALRCSFCRQVVLWGGIHVEQCGHVLCAQCLSGAGELRPESRGRPRTTRGRARCPLCTGSLAPAGGGASSSSTLLPPHQAVGGAGEDQDVEMTDVADQEVDTFRADGYSAKMEQLVADVRTAGAASKGVALSCWSMTLDLAAKHLQQAGIGYHRIDGADVPLAQRQQAVADFAASADARVLLMTTGTSIPLDLTCAGRVFVMEPQWSTDIERQAIGRAARLGRETEGPVVIRYVTRNTVEESMFLSQSSNDD